MEQKEIEEKAKAYDEAFKEASVAHKDEDRHLKATLERIFPQLKESEDDRILKHLKAVVKAYDMWAERGLDMNDILAWLEKKGEQKSADGTFVNADDVREDFVQEVYRVLDADSTNDRANQIIDAFDNLPTVTIENANKVEPRFKAGDFVRSKYNKAVVLRIEEVCNDIYKTERGGYIRIDFQDDWELMEQKPAWSEEDEKMLRTIISDGIRGAEFDKAQIDWLKFLKDRYAWKPSDKQIEALDFAVDCIVPAEFNFKRKELKGLLEQLKKLREE